MNRRNFMSSILALGAAPAIVRAESIMRIKPVLLPGEDFSLGPEEITREALRMLEEQILLMPSVSFAYLNKNVRQRYLTIRKPPRYG